jgi:hypothetical protein
MTDFFLFFLDYSRGYFLGSFFFIMHSFVCYSIIYLTLHRRKKKLKIDEIVIIQLIQHLKSSSLEVLMLMMSLKKNTKIYLFFIFERGKFYHWMIFQ